MKIPLCLRVYGLVSAFLVPCTVMAGDTGLGQDWPKAPDVSISSGYHVYVFERSGIRYVQVNDAAGRVRSAAGIAGNQIFGLPIGQDAALLSTPSDLAHGQGVPNGELIYRDDQIDVLVAPQPANALRVMVQSNCQSDPPECVVHGP